jgi:CheY-like chemotaxis protein
MPRILIVDDEPTICEMLSLELESLGHDVTSVLSPAEAISLLGKKSFDVLITDVRMPHMDGLEFMQWALNMHPDIQVVVITGHGDIDMAVQAMRQGALHFLQKPLSLKTLESIVEQCIAKRDTIIKLRQHEKHLCGVWEWNIKSEQLFLSQQCLEILMPNEIPTSLTEWRQLIDPGERNEIIKGLQQAIDQGDSRFNTQYHLDADSRIFWEMDEIVRHDATGEALRIIGVLKEVS